MTTTLTQEPSGMYKVAVVHDNRYLLYRLFPNTIRGISKATRVYNSRVRFIGQLN